MNIAPAPQLNLTFDWHVLRVSNSTIGVRTRPSPSLHRATSVRSYPDGPLGPVASILFPGHRVFALPGKALRAIGADKPWSTLQASLYWSF